MGAVQEPWMAMICFHRGQFQSCGISMDERNVFRWGWTERERGRLLLSHITPSHSRERTLSFSGFRGESPDIIHLNYSLMCFFSLSYVYPGHNNHANNFSFWCSKHWKITYYKNSTAQCDLYSGPSRSGNCQLLCVLNHTIIHLNILFSVLLLFSFKNIKSDH